MDNKQAYKIHCEKKSALTLPLFFRAGWLDTVAPGQWDVALIEKGGELFAALPYVCYSRWGFRVIDMPALTPYLGVWMRYPEGQKEGTRLSFEKEIMFALIEQLPDYSYFRQNLLPGISNGLPFHWKGFRQTSRYTYVLEHPIHPETAYEALQQNIRRQIRKAEDSMTVTPAEEEEIDMLYELKKQAYATKEQHLPVSRVYLKNIFEYCRQNECGTLLKAASGTTVHAMILLVWDHKTCYYLFGAANPDHKNSGAMSLLMWKGIQIAADKNLEFNFEGSMVESVERFFRSFGAKQQHYLQVDKYNSFVYKVLSFFRK